jgi:hypothetical protein
LASSDTANRVAAQAAATRHTRRVFLWLEQVIADTQKWPAGFKLAYGIAQYWNCEMDYAFPGLDKLATKSGLSRSTVKRMTPYLVKLGHLRVETGGGAGNHSRFWPIIKAAGAAEKEVNSEPLKEVNSEPLHESNKGVTDAGEGVQGEQLRGSLVVPHKQLREQPRTTKKERPRGRKIRFSDSQEGREAAELETYFARVNGACGCDARDLAERVLRVKRKVSEALRSVDIASEYGPQAREYLVELIKCNGRDEDVYVYPASL